MRTAQLIRGGNTLQILLSIQEICIQGICIQENTPEFIYRKHTNIIKWRCYRGRTDYETRLRYDSATQPVKCWKMTLMVQWFNCRCSSPTQYFHQDVHRQGSWKLISFQGPKKIVEIFLYLSSTIQLSAVWPPLIIPLSPLNLLPVNPVKVQPARTPTRSMSFLKPLFYPQDWN